MSRYDRPAVYEIECITPNHRYVGMSENVVHRLGSHLLGRGCVFTQKHGVKAARILCFVESIEEAKRVEQAWYRVLKSRKFTIRM